MKNWLKKNVFALCSAALALDIFFPLGGFSNFLFGEPEFPMED